MRKILAVVIFAAAITVACSRQKEADTSASDAAKAYYEMLTTGNYDGFVSGLYFTDSIPSGYREQLIAGAKMFVDKQHKSHQGISNIKVISQQSDSLSSVTDVFLLLTYSDSTKEEIVVPMIESNGRWLMK